MFAYPATELFNSFGRRVVWSQEEFEAAIIEGWSEADVRVVEAVAGIVEAAKPKRVGKTVIQSTEGEAA